MLSVRCSFLCLLLSAGIGLRGAETNPPGNFLGRGIFQAGLVRLDKNSRTITFPVRLNLRDETVEYAVVHQSGKAYESIFTTGARPQDIQVAMLLWGVRPVMTNTFGADGKGPPMGEKVFVEVSWTNGGARVACAM